MMRERIKVDHGWHYAAQNPGANDHAYDHNDQECLGGHFYGFNNALFKFLPGITETKDCDDSRDNRCHEDWDVWVTASKLHGKDQRCNDKEHRDQCMTQGGLFPHLCDH